MNQFLDDSSPRKRQEVVDELVDHLDYVRNWSTIWTNQLVGRSDSRDIERGGLARYLRHAFAANRPWNEIVGDLISAEGTVEENGASAFLLAHLNNQAVPATAITSARTSLVWT